MRKALIVLSCLLFPALAMAQNTPPVVDAGPDQTIFLGDSVTLHGTATDVDYDPILAWQWEVISAPAGSMYDLAAANTPNPTFMAETLGDYVITLVAWDGLAWSDPDALLVMVVENQPPTAIASATPLSGPAPLTVNFDGTLSSDPEGGDLIYGWDFGDGSFGSDATTAHSYDLPDLYHAILTVVDERGLTDFAVIEITVEEAPPAWGGASVVGMQPESPSTGLNCLIGLLIPLAAVLLLKRLRRR